MVGSSTLGPVSSGLWLLCNRTCEELPVNSNEEGKLHLHFHCDDELQDLGAQYAG